MAFGRPDPDALVAAFASSDFTHDEAAWQAGVAQDRSPDEWAIPELDGEGNYSSPVLDRVRSVYQDFLRQAGRRRTCLEALDKVRDGLERLLSALDLCADSGLDHPENPIHQAARSGFESFLDGLDELQEAVLRSQPELGVDALDHLQAATNRIMDAYAFFQKLRNVAMILVCPHCEAENRRGDAKCHQCSAALPIPEQQLQGQVLAENREGVLQPDTAAPALTTPNFQRVEQAVVAWTQGQLEDDGLLAEITAVESNMSGHREVNRAEMEDTEGLTAEELEVTIRLLGAIDHALEGSLAALATMKEYWDKGDSRAPERGLAQLGPPTQKMIEAFLALQSITIEED